MRIRAPEPWWPLMESVLHLVSVHPVSIAPCHTNQPLIHAESQGVLQGNGAGDTSRLDDRAVLDRA